MTTNLVSLKKQNSKSRVVVYIRKNSNSPLRSKKNHNKDINNIKYGGLKISTHFYTIF